VYGAASGDLDLNIVTEDAFQRWMAGTVGTRTASVPPAPDDGVADGLQGIAHTTPNPTESLSLGSQGANVRSIQIRLAVFGYATLVDGAWGPATQARVLAFQRAFGLQDDGIINVAGPTWTALNAKPVRPTVRPGCRGTYVAVLQRALNRLHEAGLVDDGVYTTSAASPTGSAIRAWQTTEEQEVDGVCGHLTWATVETRAQEGNYALI
jgi:peptidoglycan hydrolase-like protein with peptidoglycan-binding domain